jgi:flagellar hook assembly protein FlgD
MTVNFDISDMLSIDGSAIPEEFALHQNYPNPFNPVTSIQFDIPEQSEVRMDIYNLMGQRVATLINNTLEPGFHAVKWNGTNDFGNQLSSGMYIYRISANNFTSVKKLILMK